MTRPPFPSVISSTIVSSWRSCQRKAELEYFHHWKPLNESVHLVAGAAYAAGLEVARKSYYSGSYSAEDSIGLGLEALLKSYGSFQCPANSAKSAERTAGAYQFYFDMYPLETDTATPIKFSDGRLGVEFSFAEPIEVLHPESGQPIIYSGRFDMLCEFAGGIYGLDDKTTSQLGVSWPKQWDLRSQFTGYTWGAGLSGIKLSGFLVRGVSILKNKYETLQAITYRPAWMVERWYEQLIRDVENMKLAWESGYFDYNLDHACGEFGGCPFRQVCLSKDPLPWLAGSFEQRIWDPISRTETPLLRELL